jgi:hypothetical protein
VLSVQALTGVAAVAAAGAKVAEKPAAPRIEAPQFEISSTIAIVRDYRRAEEGGGPPRW